MSKCGALLIECYGFDITRYELKEFLGNVNFVNTT